MQTCSMAEELGSYGSIDRMDTIFIQGTGADLQPALCRESGDFKQVISTVHKGFLK